MSIKSTREISRDTAIRRILKMDALIIDKNYREIESEAFEADSDITTLVNGAEPLNVDEEALEKWTDTMLGDQIDYPLYRFSMFDNYLVNDEHEQEE
jgi:hypothetical protein